MARGPCSAGEPRSPASLAQTLRSDRHVITFAPDCKRRSSFCHLAQASASRCMLQWSRWEPLLQQGFQAQRRKPLSSKPWARRWSSSTKTGVVRCAGLLLSTSSTKSLLGQAASAARALGGALPSPRLMRALSAQQHTQVAPSASANSGASYKDNDEGFRVHDHPLFMSTDEAKAWKPPRVRAREGGRGAAEKRS